MIGWTPPIAARGLRLALFSLVLSAIGAPISAQSRPAGRRPLASTDISDIARLELLEDRRQLDTADLTRLFAADHPEIRRRAALAIGRIADKRGARILLGRPLDADTAVAATTVFAMGQLKDTGTVAWFDSLLANGRTAPTVATEAAAALGKLKTSRARASLASYLLSVKSTRLTRETIAEALLSIGRAVPRGDLAPILRWVTSTDEELRWRAVWALFRPRDPAALSALLTASSDRSGLVRSWAVRGLTKPQADSSSLTARAESRLLAATKDPDRRVRTEAIRALASYGDSTAVSTLVAALASTDAWISVSAAEGLGRMKAPWTIPALLRAANDKSSCARRITAMQSLGAFAPAEAASVARAMANAPSGYCRTTAITAVARDTTRSVADRRTDVASSDPVVRLAALRAMSAYADTTDLGFLIEQYAAHQADSSSAIASAAASGVAAVQRRRGTGAAAFFAKFSPPSNATLRRDVDRAFGAAARQAWPAATPQQRSEAEYRAIVERWVVPDYAGKPRPKAVWTTPRGEIELELYPGDAPLAVDSFAKLVESGAIVGTVFTRVVPDFVDQQRTILEGNTLRDEVNRHRLTRGNLAWATAGLDTGSPGYTLNHTPQPHNEGDFTSMGRVTRGQDVVDRIELGDAVTSAKITLPAGRVR